MSDLRLIIDACNDCLQRGERGILATVVSVQGSAYRKPGARMIFRENGTSAGFISGACLHNDLFEHAKTSLATSRATVVSYDTTSPEDIVFGLALGCGGLVRILLEPLDLSTTQARIRFLSAVLQQRSKAVLCSVISSRNENIRVGDFYGVWNGNATTTITDTAAVDQMKASVDEQSRAGETQNKHIVERHVDAEVLVEALDPATDLVVFGATPNVEPLVRFAKELGWSVVVVDHREAFATKERFPLADDVLCLRPEFALSQLHVGPATAVVIMTHHFPTDLELLKQFFPSDVGYIGLLGSRGKRNTLLKQLKADGCNPTPEQLHKFHSPVGLDIGAETPAEIALAAISEIVSITRRQHSPRPAASLSATDE